MQHSPLPDRLFLSPPHMSGREIQFVQDAFDSNYIAPLGPQVDAFEKEFSAYTGIRHCVALTSGTAATHLALRFLGSWNMDPDILDGELANCAEKGKLPKAVVPTDLYGQSCDLGRILEICDRYGVSVVCDSAEAMGARYLTPGSERAGENALHAGKGARASADFADSHRF
jgi:dTDP-4-amino-4,6-dideoxygalactose transaminase